MIYDFDHCTKFAPKHFHFVFVTGQPQHFVSALVTTIADAFPTVDAVVLVVTSSVTTCSVHLCAQFIDEAQKNTLCRVTFDVWL